MKQSHYLENAENCAQLAERAERAEDEPTHRRYKRMEEAWRALAEEQDWLDGEIPPAKIAVTDGWKNAAQIRRLILSASSDCRHHGTRLLNFQAHRGSRL
jgi:hypothetical protein